jgi:hypothetical protein
VGYVRQTSLPQAEPVTLAEMKNFLRIGNTFTDDDQLIAGLIQAAREHAEKITGRAIAQRTFRMVLDSHPYYTDTIQSQLAYPPSYYSLPRYSTTLWNYSQMIKLPFPPVISVQQMRYIDPTGNAQIMRQDVDFVLDRMTEPARIFPVPGQYWPADLYVANAVEIDFTAGYDPNPAAAPDTHNVALNPPMQQPDSTIVTAVPQSLRRTIMLLVSNWYDNRWQEVPPEIDMMLYNDAVIDFAPTRG